MKSVFEYRNNLIEDFSRFSQSFVKPRADDIAKYLNDEDLRRSFWPEPLLQINPHYQMGESVTQLVSQGILDPECQRLFLNKKTGTPLDFYVHQGRAITAAARHENYILTTGTGSGKSLSFFVPIVDRILKEKKRDKTPRTRAIIMYPMNALANSQLEEIKGFLSNDPDCGVTVGRYTGQESSEERKSLADNPPDILLTNYMMMELILTRYEDVDVKVIEHSRHLEFLVLDELHTYRGRQGADVALLIRRMRFRLESSEMICIGTSATMTSIGSDEDQRTAVAQTASVLFGTEFKPDNVITETLKRVTDPTVDMNLGTLLKARMSDDSPFSSDYDILRRDPLAVWVELNLSLDGSSGTNKRANPKELSHVYTLLAEQADCSIETARKKLNELLEVASSEGTGLFAFKLHQFISGPSFLMTSLQPEGERVITVDEQIKARDSEGGEVPLFRTYFCRDCGQEYLPVYLSGDIFTPRHLDERPEDDDSVEWGFLVPYPDDPDDFDYLPSDMSTLPPSWREYRRGLEVISKDKQRYVPRLCNVGRTGKMGQESPEYLFIPGTVRFCPCCGVEMEERSREQNKLTGLSGEGRSSATTILTMNLLNQMFEDDGTQRKILGFVDNRQDAALQSGHFNDFVNRATMRGAALAAIDDDADRQWSIEELCSKIFEVLGFSDPCDREAQAELYLEPDKPEPVRRRHEQTALDVLRYRIINEMKKAWKYSNPTVFHLGLVKAVYRDFDLMMQDSGKISKYEVFGSLPSDARKRLMETLLGEMVGQYCISDQILGLSMLEEKRRHAQSILNPRWGFDDGERLFEGNRLAFGKVGPQRLEGSYHYLSCTANSKLGRLLRKDKIWKLDRQFVGKTKKELSDIVGKLIQEMLDLSSYYGIVERKPDSEERRDYYQVASSSILLFRGDGFPDNQKWRNEYFQTLYVSIGRQFQARNRGLFQYSSSEHTAQVSSDEREVLEKRFRGEPGFDPLPVLYCSPTMELGIDISSLNTVYMRNVPPTPANYAQRSGRAGRSGQAALVVTYCASQSPHDQWYFKHSSDMVSGAVVTPSLDLSNKDLIDSHLMAVWFAAAKCRINSAISEVIDIETYEMKDEIKAALARPSLADEALEGVRDLTSSLSSYLSPEKAPWYSEGYERNLVSNAYDRFRASFESWITLVKDTKNQMTEANRKLLRGPTVKERRILQKIHDDASMQLTLLTNPPKGANTASSDFYIYRYLAGQGILPGYNFPRLPIIAWIPQTRQIREDDNGDKMVSISRSRFLALSEFGPQSVIYHRGNSFRVYKVKLNASTAVDNQNGQLVLATKSVVMCSYCGFGVVSSYDGTVTDDRCPCCNAVLDKSNMVPDLYKIETVETKAASAITSNDEERMRRGYDLQTFYSYDKADTREIVKGVLDDCGDTVAIMRYIPNATIYKVNKGWRNRRNKADYGFFINPSTGIWKKESTDDGDDDGEEKDFRQKIVPYAEDRKNCLILEMNLHGRTGKAIAPTLQSAFARGISNVFQIEGSELAVELLTDNGDSKSILFYESSEGGAGVLSRIVSSEQYLKAICMNALEVMHYSFDMTKGRISVSDLVDVKPECLAGCYSCLLSYYNQTSHADIDRRDPDVLNILVSMANGQFTEVSSGFYNSDFSAFLEANNLVVTDLEKDKSIRNGDVIPYYTNSSKTGFFTETPRIETRDYLEQRGILICIIGKTEQQWKSNLDSIRRAIEGGTD